MLMTSWLKTIRHRLGFAKRTRGTARRGRRVSPVFSLMIGNASDLNRRLQLAGIGTNIEHLEDRTLLAVDLGDAPDTSAGTGTGDYQTTAANGGPSHTVVAGLFLGDTVDGSEDGTLQNARANADDVDGALPDDEDGVLDPANDLI